MSMFAHICLLTWDDTTIVAIVYSNCYVELEEKGLLKSQRLLASDTTERSKLAAANKRCNLGKQELCYYPTVYSIQYQLRAKVEKLNVEVTRR